MRNLQKAKYFIAGMIFMTILFTLITSAAANFTYPSGTVESSNNTPTRFRRDIRIMYDDYKVFIDGTRFEPTDRNGVITPFTFEGWIYAPFEHIAKALGHEVRWDGSTNSLHISACKPSSGSGGTTATPTGRYSFTIKNDSYYSIYAVFIAPAGTPLDDYIDILPEILRPGQSIRVEGTVPSNWASRNDWSFFAIDTDYDTSANIDSFNPWTLRSVDINWSIDAGGYMHKFNY